MNQPHLQNIRLLALSDIEQFLIANNEKPFRARQVYDWLWLRHAVSFDSMTNISKNLRQLLTDNFFIYQTTISTFQKSADGTVKVSFRLHDNNIIEGVLIPDKDRLTACISSQAGCALNCSFCATGSFGFRRDLSFDEIFDQIALLKEFSTTNYELQTTNFVFMGMGEPLMNYDNLLLSIRKITSPDCFGISPKRITVSTVGIPDRIKQLADDISAGAPAVNLAISIHSANDSRRSSIAPVNKKYPLSALSSALKYFHQKTGIRITYEYLLIKDINDSLQDAMDLAHFCKISPCKINLIEYNDNDLEGFRKSSPAKLKIFADFLKSRNLVVNIRRSRGTDIKAACGQLANSSP